MSGSGEAVSAVIEPHLVSVSVANRALDTRRCLGVGLGVAAIPPPPDEDRAGVP